MYLVSRPVTEFLSLLLLRGQALGTWKPPTRYTDRTVSRRLVELGALCLPESNTRM